MTTATEFISFTTSYFFSIKFCKLQTQRSALNQNKIILKSKFSAGKNYIEFKSNKFIKIS